MRFLLLALALVFLAESADAQRHREFAEQGDLALVIGVSGLEHLVLRPYEGGIGFRYRAADRTVLGAAVALNLSEGDFETRSASDDRGLSREGSDDMQGASFAVWVEQHVGRRRRTVSPFLGAAVQVSMNSSDDASGVVFECPEADCPIEERYRNEAERLSAGVGLVLGGEIRLARGVTVGGAYTLGVEYSRYEATSTRTGPGGSDESSTESDVWRFGVGTTQVGLSIYF